MATANEQIGLQGLLDTLSTILTPQNRDSSSKGELVIAGSGIAALRQMSLESIQYIRAADVVYHAAQTAAEEAFIAMNAKASFDLRRLYGTQKSRATTYVQMSELMLRDVRAGKLVVGLFYGHPGVFAAPGHRAIAIAREEGFSAKMLPGISAEDNLIADLGIEPALPGSAQYEATFLVYNDVEVDTKLHILIWQAGALGQSTMDMKDNANFPLLLDYLEKRYGSEYPIFVYQAGVMPGERSRTKSYSITELRDTDLAHEVITSGCTLYLPPKDVLVSSVGPVTDRNPHVLSFPREATDTKVKLFATSSYRKSHPELPVQPFYGEKEKQIVADLDAYLGIVENKIASAKKEEEPVPGQYNPMVSSPEMKQVAIAVTLSHHMLPETAESRSQMFADLLAKLSPDEREAVISVDPYAMERFMRQRRGPSLNHPITFITANCLILVVLETMLAEFMEQHDGLLVGLA